VVKKLLLVNLYYMPRVKRGNVRTKKRRAVLSQTKGFMWGRKNLIKQAKTAVKKAGVYAFRDRRAKKRTNRGLWQINLSAATKEKGISYSKFINSLKKQAITLDRKILATLAKENPEIFAKILENAQTTK